MSGTLRIGHVLGTSKIILNALSSTKDFYVNGDSQFNGNLIASSINSNGYIQGGSLLTTEIDTNGNNNLDIQRNNVSMIELQDGKTVFKTGTECQDIFYCDHFENEPASLLIDHIMNEPTGQIKYSVGSPTVPDATTNLVMALKTDKVEINKPAVLGDVLNTNTIDSNGISDITFKKHTFDICYLKNSSLELNTGINLVAPAQIQANTYNSFDDSSALFFRNGDEYMRFRKTEGDILITKKVKADNDITIENGRNLIVRDVAIPTGQSLNIRTDGVSKLGLSTTSLTLPVGLNLYGDIIYGNTFRARQEGVDTISYGGNTAGNSNIEYFRLNKTTESIDFIKDININTGSNLTGDIIRGTSIHSNDCFANRFRVRHTNEDTNFDGANVAEDGRLTFMVYRHLLEDLRILKNVLIDDGKKLQCNIFAANGNNDVEFQRVGIPYLSFIPNKIECKKNIIIIGR